MQDMGFQSQEQMDTMFHSVALFDLSEGLETPIQLIYLLTLLGFLGAGAFLVVRQVLIRRELDEAAKQLGERIRTGEATCEDCFELGVILTRKRLYTQATKNLEKAKKIWDGEESELAQVHNALGYCYLNMEKVEDSVTEFQKAVELQPGYVTAWNNLGDAYERIKNWRSALSAYQEALSYAPDNAIARQRSEFCRTRCERLGLN
jgi:tetratricopeptide (TPR) repeat protein